MILPNLRNWIRGELLQNQRLNFIFLATVILPNLRNWIQGKFFVMFISINKPSSTKNARRVHFWWRLWGIRCWNKHDTAYTAEKRDMEVFVVVL